MPTYYFFSAFDANVGFSGEIATHLKSDIKDYSLLVFISANFKTDYYVAITTQWFEKIGIEFEKCILLDSYSNLFEAKEIIENASCIYLMGGYPLEQFEYLSKNKLLATIRQSKAIIIGESAGAINISKHSIYSKEEDFEKTTIYKGIGLTEISIEPHFLIDKQDLLEKELFPLSHQFCIYGVCDNSAVIVKDKAIIFLGDVFKIENGMAQLIMA